MAGHSKWKNIQRRKNAQDAKRGKVFMKMAKEVFIAAKQGGADMDTNPALRLAVDKAKSNNMPNENIDRAIKKATGDLDGVHYEELIYEGYGPGGAAVIVEALTDNKNRTASEVRYAFNKNGGNLGENGCVSFMFDRKGYIVIDQDSTSINEDILLLEVIEAGADEMESLDDCYAIYTDVEDFNEVKEQLEDKGFTLETAELTMVPQTLSPLEQDEARKMVKLIDMLEDLEDVQEVYHNLDADEDVINQL
ncbi:YebC/PmpR family DNA-binding transcriptional regulator [Aquibacillus rhizosphaerae]|uniref:Probable transcriptional regulatory protein QQS35_14475 n=1 Tax=Aquibacillus rhizosphaerae TaxID=3051431 RepID=A0ABT7L6Z6_9BACI|nr:YebC/PmpR family DNA-binding transcriptional regulator [Aquibacillus sp. LR5S19]MDL4841643.1 YebC/PmpR family DNA-binding transcriptional regulator [Aquibacillus sp. LR5S19]